MCIISFGAMIILRSRNYYPHFTDKENKVRKVINLSSHSGNKQWRWDPNALVPPPSHIYFNLLRFKVTFMKAENLWSQNFLSLSPTFSHVSQRIF